MTKLVLRSTFIGIFTIKIMDLLGRSRRLGRQLKLQASMLCSYYLHVDQVENLQPDGALYARIMAEMIADLFWRTHIDANDMEFILAPLRRNHITQFVENSAQSTTINSHVSGEHVVWIHDFDFCKHLSLGDRCVDLAVETSSLAAV